MPDQVRALITDALRHWAAQYDVDGFCFVNAETMAQGAAGARTLLPLRAKVSAKHPSDAGVPMLALTCLDTGSSALLHAVHAGVHQRGPCKHFLGTANSAEAVNHQQCNCCCAQADRHGTVLDNPPLPEEIALDPLLGALKLVAWSGNDALLPRGGDRGAAAFQAFSLFACCPMTATHRGSAGSMLCAWGPSG